MNDVDQQIRSDLDRAISAAPPPVSVETIWSRDQPMGEHAPRSNTAWAVVALPALAAVAMVVVAFLVVGGEPGPGSSVDLEASDVPTPDLTQPPSSVAATETDATETEVTVQSGLWLSEIVPQIADQLPNVTATELWAALDSTDPRPPFAPTAERTWRQHGAGGRNGCSCLRGRSGQDRDGHPQSSRRRASRRVGLGLPVRRPRP